MTKTQNKKRKGFTIVELVIVIAVIAILAGVLIPTFGGIIESANRSADTQLVAQINTILTVQDLLNGGVNEVVDIQNAIKENGLKLETKSKGAYLWYDRDSGKVVLGSLDENNNLEIISGDTSTLAQTDLVIDADRPVLLGDEEGTATETALSLKGKFDINMITLEGFIHGYYFISETSKDGFAEKICAIRNAQSEDGLRGALTEVSEVNASVGQQFTLFMQNHPLITNNDVIFLGDDDDKDKPSAAIVGSGVTEITADVITELATYPNINHIDLHPGVSKVDGTIGSLSGDTDFFHSSLDVDSFCKGNGITNVHLKGERDKFIQTMNLVYVNTKGEVLSGWSGNNPELNKTRWKVTLAPWLDSQVAGAANKVYDFVGYSFEKDGTAPISLGTTNYFLTEADKIKVNESTGAITIYAVYDIDETADFEVGGKFYGSRAVTYMLYTKAIQSGNVVVSSTDAVLDASLIGLANAELTIPSGVTLWVPCSVTNYSARNNGIYYPQYVSSARATYGTFDKDNSSGVAKLTIESTTTLVNNGYITVDAQVYQQGDSAHFNFISDNSGVLVVNGKIINQSGSRMEAYGVVRTTANGSVDAKSGSTITETMSVLDLHGGQTTIVSIKKGISPFNSYTIDSIRLPLTIEYGSIYTAYGMIETSLGEHEMEFKIASHDGSPDTEKADNPLFNMSSNAKFVKSYKAGEGIKVTIYGTVEDCKKKISLGSGDTLVDFTFEKVPMPLPDFDVTIASGAKLTLSKATAYKVLPGSDIIVEEGGTLNLGSRLIVYDSFELNNVPSTLTARQYVTRDADGKIVSYAFTELSASLLVKGTIVLDNGAKFAGIVIGDENDQYETDDTKKSKIIIVSGAATSCSPVKEGANGKMGCTSDTIDEYTVKDMNWTGRWQTAPETYGQIPATPGTYTYNGATWN